MRATAYEYALDWAKTHTAGGDKPIINHQAVGYMLTDIAMRIEACRAFSWKAAHYLDKFDSDGHAIGAMSKIYCGEVMFETEGMSVHDVETDAPSIRFTFGNPSTSQITSCWMSIAPTFSRFGNVYKSPWWRHPPHSLSVPATDLSEPRSSIVSLVFDT